MKKIIFLLIITLSLSSCFNNDKGDWLNQYDKWENFSIRIPNNWEIIDNKDSILPKPKSWKIELAVKSKTEIDWFLNNILILSEKVKENTDIINYINSENINIEKEYFEYKKIKENEITFSDQKKSKIIIFEARYNNSTPKLKFLQTASICKDKIYYITLAIPKNIDDVSKYEYMLWTFNCKK